MNIVVQVFIQDGNTNVQIIEEREGLNLAAVQTIANTAVARAVAATNRDHQKLGL